MRKSLNSSVPEELITRIDEFVSNSKGDFRDRSHLVEQAIKLYMGDEILQRGNPSKNLTSTPNFATSSSLYETSLFPRLSIHTREKRVIAEQAASLIAPGKILFMDGSTTCIELAKILAKQKKRLTIVTNSTLICVEMGHSNENKVIGIGGEYDPASASFIGPISEKAVEDFYVDYGLMSTKGFLPNEGTFESSMGTLRIKQIAAGRCSRLILLVDHSKFGQRSLCKVLDLNQIHTIVTDSNAPQEAITFMEQNGRQVLIANLNGQPEGENKNATQGDN